MNDTVYTPGYSENAVAFMSRRTLQSHGQFAIPALKPGAKVLDCGCGPGTISVEIAEKIRSGSVVGVDADESQVGLARQLASDRNADNIEFLVGEANSLQFSDESFDVVFSHALLEHVPHPSDVAAEFRRVLRPGGVLAICSPYWSGALVIPSSEALRAAMQSYKALQSGNGGDLEVGRSLGEICRILGFGNIRMSARYEVYEPVTNIGEYLALQLEAAGNGSHAESIRQWSREAGALFAQSWVSCTAVRV